MNKFGVQTLKLSAVVDAHLQSVHTEHVQESLKLFINYKTFLFSAEHHNQGSADHLCAACQVVSKDTQGMTAQSAAISH